MLSRFRLSVVVVAVVVAAALVGAGPVGAQAGGVITHWQHYHEGRAPVLESLIEDFGQSSGITVQTEKIPYDTYFDKLILALGTKSGPDVFQVPQTMIPELMAAGVLAPIPASVMTRAQAEELFVPWTIENLLHDDAIYGVPTDVQTLLLFINVDLAVEAGLDPSSPPATWDELKEWAVQATKKDAQGLVQGGLDTRYKWAVFNLFLAQALGDKPVVDFAAKRVNYDGPEGLAAWNFIRDLMVVEGVDSPTFLTGQQKFEQKRSVLYINHPVTRSRLDQAVGDAAINYTAVLPPSLDGGELIIPGNSWAYVINKDSPNMAAAAEWIRYLASEEVIKQWAIQAGDLPSLKSLLEDPEIAFDDIARVAVESMLYAVPVRQTGGKDVDDIRSEIWDNIVIGGMSVEQAVAVGAAAENALILRKLR